MAIGIMQEIATAVPSIAGNRYHQENDRCTSDCSNVTIHFVALVGLTNRASAASRGPPATQRALGTMALAARPLQALWLGSHFLELHVRALIIRLLCKSTRGPFPKTIRPWIALPYQRWFRRQRTFQ